MSGLARTTHATDLHDEAYLAGWWAKEEGEAQPTYEHRALNRSAARGAMDWEQDQSDNRVTVR